MHILDVHNELCSHYNGCFGINKQGKVVHLMEILTPDSDGDNDWGDPDYSSYPEDLEVHSSKQYFQGYVTEYENNVFYKDTEGGHESKTVALTDISFCFPESKLVQCKIDTNGSQYDFVKYVDRYSSRQYRRALRTGSLTALHVNGWTYSTLRNKGLLFGRDSSSVISSVQVADIVRYIDPTYVGYRDALELLKLQVGTYAISEEWWVGQGKKGIVIGWKSYSVGAIDEDGIVTLNDNALFLSKSLSETLGAT